MNFAKKNNKLIKIGTTISIMISDIRILHIRYHQIKRIRPFGSEGTRSMLPSNRACSEGERNDAGNDSGGIRQGGFTE